MVSEKNRKLNMLGILYYYIGAFELIAYTFIAGAIGWVSSYGFAVLNDSPEYGIAAGCFLAAILSSLFNSRFLDLSIHHYLTST